jgi:DNA-binding NtrC family response regulator
VLETASRVAVTETTVLVTGESGNGKEIVRSELTGRSSAAGERFGETDTKV